MARALRQEWPKNRQWLPIQIAPDECDLEPWRLHKTGLLAQVRRLVQRPGGRGDADFALAWADLMALPLDAGAHMSHM
ncbi:hypothetical protein [Bradyrhizobium sp. P5_C11_2]